MNKEQISNIIKKTKSVMKKHSPEILTGLGIAGMITTTVLAVKATPRALDLIDGKKHELDVHKLTAGETIKVAWKCYIPAVITGTASTICLVGASATNLKRNAALATAYKISETALAEYKEKVVETLGEKKEKAIREKIAEDRVKDNPVSKNDVIITGKGNTLCYEYLSGRYFESDVDKIRRAEYELNRAISRDNYASLNDFYDELGLNHTEMGEELGWRVDQGYITIDFSAQLAEDDRPCMTIDYSVPPKYGYSSLY